MFFVAYFDITKEQNAKELLEVGHTFFGASTIFCLFWWKVAGSAELSFLF